MGERKDIELQSNRQGIISRLQEERVRVREEAKDVRAVAERANLVDPGAEQAHNQSEAGKKVQRRGGTRLASCV